MVKDLILGIFCGGWSCTVFKNIHGQHSDSGYRMTLQVLLRVIVPATATVRPAFLVVLLLFAGGCFAMPCVSLSPELVIIPLTIVQYSIYK